MIKINCEVCGKEIINPRINQRTCGNKNCIRKYNPLISFRLNKKFIEILEREQKKKPKIERISVGRTAKYCLYKFMINKKLIFSDDLNYEDWINTLFKKNAN